MKRLRHVNRWLTNGWWPWAIVPSLVALTVLWWLTILLRLYPCWLFPARSGSAFVAKRHELRRGRAREREAGDGGRSSVVQCRSETRAWFAACRSDAGVTRSPR